VKRVQYLTTSWFVLTATVIIGGCIYSYTQGKGFNLELSKFLLLVLSTSAIVTSGSLMHRALTEQALIELLQFDVVSIHIGAIATVWLSIAEIIEILK
jgi:hypothetical protein